MEDTILIRIDDLRWINNGAYGWVFEVLHRQPPICMKHIGEKMENHEQVHQVEAETLKRLRHKNIVQYRGIARFQDTNNKLKFGILMEYCERGALSDLMENPKITYTMHTVLSWGLELFKALAYLQEKKVVHRDIKPDNIFVAENFVLKLGDFGIMKEMTRTLSDFTDIGTPRYMSPEQAKVAETNKLSHRSDVYSMGLVVWEMIERRIVFSEFGKDFYPHGAAIHKLIEDLDCTPAIKDLVQRCTNFDVTQRPHALELIPQIEELKKQQKQLRIKPSESEGEVRLMKPIGFDGTKRKAYIGHEESLLPDDIGSLNPTKTNGGKLGGKSTKSEIPRQNQKRPAVPRVGGENNQQSEPRQHRTEMLLVEAEMLGMNISENPVVRRGPGRPPGSKNKPKTTQAISQENSQPTATPRRGPGRPPSSKTTPK